MPPYTVLNAVRKTGKRKKLKTFHRTKEKYVPERVKSLVFGEVFTTLHGPAASIVEQLENFPE
jgi:hypothetical protein